MLSGQVKHLKMPCTMRFLRPGFRWKTGPSIAFLFLILCFSLPQLCHLAAADSPRSNLDNYNLFARSNLVAWCIVPFDAKKRGPEERAAMLEKLGFQLFAYDYRAEHVPTFDAEMDALQRHHIRL